MIADALLVIGLVMIVTGVVKRQARWGLAVLSAGAGIFLAVVLMAWTDIGDSFIRGVRDGFRDAGQ